MDVALQKSWTAEDFLAQADSREGRYEFDGTHPVAMTDGTVCHNRITTNINAAVRSHLRGRPRSYFGPDLDVSTVGETLRLPSEASSISLVVGVAATIRPVSARRLRVVWSGTASSSPSGVMMEPVRPSVWRRARLAKGSTDSLESVEWPGKGRRNTVNAAAIAKGKWSG